MKNRILAIAGVVVAASLFAGVAAAPAMASSPQSSRVSSSINDACDSQLVWKNNLPFTIELKNISQSDGFSGSKQPSSPTPNGINGLKLAPGDSATELFDFDTSSWPDFSADVYNADSGTKLGSIKIGYIGLYFEGGGEEQQHFTWTNGDFFGSKSLSDVVSVNLQDAGGHNSTVTFQAS